MTAVMMFAVSVLIGWLAQSKKGRTGAKWAVGSFTLMAAAWVFLFFCMSLAKPGMFDSDANLYGLAIMDVGGVGILMGLALWSLPSKEKGKGDS